MKNIFRVLTAISLFANMLAAPIYASAEVLSDTYTVGDGYILGVENNLSVESFLEKIEASAEALVEDGNTGNPRTGNVLNGDVLKADGEEYIIHTKEFKRTYYANDDFEDGKLGSWTRTGGNVESFAVEEVTDNDKALTIKGTGSVTGNRQVKVTGNPAVIAEEMTLRLPELNNSQVGIIVRNASDKYMSVMRFMNFGKYGLHSLDPNGYYTMSTDILANTEYKIKNVTNTSSGKISTYLDGVCVAENKDTQAVKNSPNDYIPTGIYINVNEMNSSGIGLQISDYKMYGMETVNVEKIEYIHNGKKNNDLRNVPVDMPEFKVYFMTDNGKIDSESVEQNVKLLDDKGSSVPSFVSYDASEKCCKIIPQKLLNNDKRYSIDIKNVKDSKSGCEFSGNYALKTDSTVVPICLASATAKCGTETYSDISSVRRDIETVTLKFIYQDSVTIDDTDIDSCFDFVDKNGMSIDYRGSYNSEEQTYTFRLEKDLYSGETYKIKIMNFTDLSSNVKFNKEISIRAVGASLIDTDKYTVGDGFVMGVNEGIAVDKFLSELVCLGTPVVYEGKTDTRRIGTIHNGDTVEVSGKRYVIETNIFPNDDIFYDRFTDGTRGSWSGSPMLSVITDSEKGKVLSWEAIGAAESAKKSFTSSRSVSIDNLPGILVFEYDIKFPVFNSNMVGVIMKNSASKYLATLRLLPEGGKYKLKALYTGGYQELLSDVEEDKWYRVKYMMDTATGLCDIYIDSELVAENSKIQAIQNSPGNYTPTVIEISGSEIKSDGITAEIGNIELYSPSAVKLESITANKGDSKFNVLEGLPVDIDSLKVKLTCDNQIDTASLEGNISLLDSEDNSVDCEITVNTLEPSYTIKPKSILKNNSVYTVKISNVKDTAYNTSLNKSYKISTNSKSAGAKVFSITAKSGEEVYNNISSIRTDTDTIEIKFVFGDGISVNSDDAEQAVELYLDNIAEVTQKSFNPSNNVLTISLSNPLLSGKVYELKINNLKDTDGQTVLNYFCLMRAVAQWIVDAGEVIQSDKYSVSDDEITGIPQGMTAGEFLNSLGTIPGTSAVVYTDEAKTQINSGILTSGNIIEAYNSYTQETKIYRLTVTGLKLKSKVYNIIDDTILGAELGMSAEEFVGNLEIFGADSAEVLDSDNNAVTAISNNCKLKLTSGARIQNYKIETINTDDTVYFKNEFNNGTEGWSSGTVTDDAEKGKVLSWIIEGATAEAKKSVSSQLTTLEINETPEILVFETDIKMPVLPKSLIAIQAKNQKDKYLSVLRIDQKELFYTLVPNAQSNIAENMKANKWYHVKYVNNCVNGTTDIYLDGKLVGEGLKFQATDNFIPNSLTVTVDNTSVNGTVLSVDNMTMYKPNPITAAYVDTVSGGNRSADITSVPINVDEINVHLAVRDGYNIKNKAEECVTLIDDVQNIIPSKCSYDSVTKTIKIIPKEILKGNSDYTVKISGIIDDVYKKSFNKEIVIHTSDFGFNMMNSFAMSEAGDRLSSFNLGKMTLHIPFVNLKQQKNVTFMFVTFDSDGRMMSCNESNVNANASQLEEAIFNLDFSGFENLPASAKIYTREQNGGPLSEPYDVRISD